MQNVHKVLHSAQSGQMGRAAGGFRCSFAGTRNAAETAETELPRAVPTERGLIR